MTTGIVILAAGESARLGTPKQMLAYRGTTLLRHTINIALEVIGSPVIVVLGAHAAQVRAQLNGLDVHIIENPDWKSGMAGSVRVGLSTLLAVHPKIDAVLFLVCDQPLISASHLDNLIATLVRTGAPVVASEYEDALGVPALFARALFPDLRALSGSKGARQVIQAHRDQAIGVPFEGGTVDIDTPADYARLVESSDDI